MTIKKEKIFIEMKIIKWEKTTRMNIVLIKDKERKYIGVIAKLFSITIGWLCEPFVLTQRAYVMSFSSYLKI